MAYNKRTWLGRQGTGLNKFSIGGASPVTIVNQPDSVTQVGDALSAGNMNDLENRIADAFDDVDTALATKADQTEVTDLKNACSALDKRVTNLELKTGDQFDVDYPSDTYGIDGVPSNVEPYAEVSVLKGVGRIANNLFNKANLHRVNGSATIADGVVTFTGDGIVDENPSIPTVSGHIYLFAYTSKNTIVGTTNIANYLVTTSERTKDIPSSTNYQRNAFLFVGEGRNNSINFNVGNSTSGTLEVKDMVLCDLTVYFNGNIPSNAQTLADIQKNYPELLIPSDYGTEVVFPTYTAVKSVGRNLIDPSALTFGKYIDDQSGTLQGNDPIYCASGWMDVLGGDTYYYMTSASAWGAWYDENKVYISGFTGVGTHTAPSNARYARVSGRTATYETTLCFNQSDSQNGTYTPYMTDTLTLPAPVTLKGAGSAYDSCELNVEVEGVARKRTTQRIAGIDLSTLNFTYNTGLEIWYAPYTSGVPFSGSRKNLLYHVGTSESYLTLNADPNILGYYMNDGVASGSERIYIRNGSKTVAPTGMFYYAAPTPTVTLSDPIPDPFIQVEGGGTIKPVQSQSPEVDSAMTVEYMAS